LTTKARELRIQAADPLGNGVQVILLLGFGCALMLALLGFFTYSAITIQKRQADWAVLDALGVTTRTVLALIAAEHGLVLGGSLIAGVCVGLALVATTSPFLQVVSPGDLAQGGVPWQTLVPLVGGLILALASASLLLLVYVQRRAGRVVSR
jgi:ABC-type antimicrobial peptide transport system permease subunit